LGTNFTLTSPFVILAHYTELEWAKEYGLEKGLVRISVGLEEMEELVLIFERALKTIEMGIDAKDR
jgi:cystathionine gamma-synthase